MKVQCNDEYGPLPSSVAGDRDYGQWPDMVRALNRKARDLKRLTFESKIIGSPVTTHGRLQFRLSQPMIDEAWPNLQELSLASFRCTSISVSRFLATKVPNLKRLAMKNVKIEAGSTTKSSVIDTLFRIGRLRHIDSFTMNGYWVSDMDNWHVGHCHFADYDARVHSIVHEIGEYIGGRGDFPLIKGQSGQADKIRQRRPIDEETDIDALITLLDGVLTRKQIKEQYTDDSRRWQPRWKRVDRMAQGGFLDFEELHNLAEVHSFVGDMKKRIEDSSDDLSDIDGSDGDF